MSSDNLDTDPSGALGNASDDAPASEHSKPNRTPSSDSPSLKTTSNGIPIASSQDATNFAADPEELTPLRAHYLKKTLIQLQFKHELDVLASPAPHPDVSTLSYLGPPFNPPPKNAPRIDLPFSRFIFRQFVLTFPFFSAAPKNFFPQKLQPFLSSALSRNLSPVSIIEDDAEEAERATRLKMLARVEKQLSLLLGAAVKLKEPEEVVRLSQSDLRRLEEIAKRRTARELKNRESFDVNIICVRLVTEKGRVRSRMHEEFIIRTRQAHQPAVYVSRRYGDFRTLCDELRKAHPDEQVRPPPAKDKKVVTAPPSASLSGTFGLKSPPPSSIQRSFTTVSDESLPTTPTVGSMNASRLAREKNRLTLRAYLHSLLSSSRLASSPVLRSFLLSGPTKLSEDEREDAQRREEVDRVRDEGKKHFAKEIASRVDGLRGAIQSVKGDLYGKDGLTRIFATVKTTPSVNDLPPDYKAVLEWARISLASTVFHHFVADDNASETFTNMKRLHGLMPYFMMKAALKISNPMGMIRGILDLFLAQPFGGRSLLQRMFTSSMTEEVKTLEEDIAAVKEKIDDPVICEKVRLFVYAPREIQDVYKVDAAEEKLHLLTIVLRSGDAPALSRVQMQRVMRAHRAYAQYQKRRATLADSDDDDGPQDEDAWLYEDLIILTKLYSRLRDREQLIGLIFEGSTAELLKDIITIFYAPLAQVYKAASIADSLGDLQTFVNDLIKTVEATEELSQEDPTRTVKIFIDLIQRHEQAFYNFVHKVHSKGSTLFDSLMRWIELFLTLIREGIGETVSLEFALPHSGLERRLVLKEVDAIALYHYKLKLAYEDKVRRRFGKSQVAGNADAEEESTQALVNGVVGDLSFGELVEGDAQELAAEDSDSDLTTSSEEESSEEESSEENIARLPLPSPASSLSKINPVPKRSYEGTRSAPPVRPTRSRASSLSQSSGPPHFDSRNAPPVPPLPKTLSLNSPNLNTSSFLGDKSLPQPPASAPPVPQPRQRLLSLSRSKSRGNLRPSQSPARPTHAPPLDSHKKKPTTPTIKAPDLEHIPNLLPVFVALVEPSLQPQALS